LIGIYLERTAIILAPSDSKGFNEDKGTIEIDGKPLLWRVVKAAQSAADEIIIVTTSKEQVSTYEKLFPSKEVRFVVSKNSEGLLALAVSGFEAAEGNYSLLLPYDSPFVSTEFISLLFDLSCGKTAVIARTPDCEAEALHAVYNTKQALAAANEALAENNDDIEALVEKLRCVRYLSTMVVEQLDPELKTFFRIITPLDVKKAAVLSKPRKTKK
jgi:molybdopterin-guanine dinucleotide biosynthesis protein A